MGRGREKLIEEWVRRGRLKKGEHFRKVGSLKDCFLNALLRNPSSLAFSSITNTYTVSLVSEGALDDFDKAKPSPAPTPTTTAPDASGPQKRSPGDTANV